jgi:hypothetical protein
MGRVISKQIKGMSWMAKVSLVLLCTLLTSVFMYQGWYKPLQSQAAVTLQQAWSQLYTGSALPGSYPYTVNPGSDRVLVVGVTSTLNTAGTGQTCTVTYGGQTLSTATANNGTSARQHTYLFYLPEAKLQLATNTNLAVSLSAGTTWNNTVYAAVYNAVDQNLFANIGSFNSGSSRVSTVGPLSPTLNIATGDIGVEIINLANSANTASSRTISTWSTGWSSAVGPTSGTGAAGVTSYAAVNSTAGTGITSSHTSSTATSAMSALVLKGIQGPTVTSVSPNFGTPGQSYSVTVGGSNFLSGATVSFGSGIDITSTSLDSASQITVGIAITAGVTVGNRDVTVTNPGQPAGTLTNGFRVASATAPTISTVTPSALGQGANGVHVAVTGTNFDNTTTITPSGTGVTAVVTYLDSTNLDVVFTVTAAATVGTRDLVIAKSDGTNTTKLNALTINARPTMSLAVPSAAPPGTTNLDVVVTGTGFVTGATSTFGDGITVNTTTVNSPTSLTANITIVGGATLGQRSITVTNPDYGTNSANLFNVSGPAPTITSLAPTALGQGASAKNVIITGANFVSGAAVTVSGTGVTVNSTAFDSSTQLTVNLTVAAGATTGARDVTVTLPDTQFITDVGALTINAAPTLTSAMPINSLAGKTLNVVLTGTGFVDGATANFGAGITANTTTFTSATSLACNITIAADAAVGSRSVTVTNPDFGAISASVFAVRAATDPVHVWTNVYHNALYPTTAIPYPVGAADGRVLVVAVSSTLTAADNQTCVVTYGGQAMTSQVTDGSDTRQRTWIFTLNEAGLQAAGSTDLVVTLANPTGAVTPRINDVFATVYDGVDQTSPITDSKNYNSGVTTVTSFAFTAPGLTVDNGDIGLEIINATRSGSTSTRTLTPAVNWTAINQQTNSVVDGIRNAVLTRSRPASTVLDLSSTTMSGSGNLVSMSAISLRSTLPKILSVTPNLVAQGSINLDVTLSGANFPVGNATATFSGNGITVNSTNVINSTTISVNITIAADATVGARDVSVALAGGATAAKAAVLTVTVPNHTVTGELTTATTATSLAVNVSYTNDGNNNNSCEIRWGTAAGSYPNVATATKGSNVYTAMITGLTGGNDGEGKRYYVQATFSDLDGVQGTNPLLGSDITVSSPLMHNSKNSQSTKWPQGWGIDGGKYGAFTCSTCHNNNTTNAKLIAATVTSPSGEPFGEGGSNSVPVVYRNKNISLATAGPYTSTTNICEVCHTKTDYHLNTGPGAPHSTNVCTSCHLHSIGFGGGSCVVCHSRKIVRTVGPAAGQTLADVVTEFNQAWSHKRSAGGVVTDADCIVCHLEGDATNGKSTAKHGDGYIDLRDPDGATTSAAITDIDGGTFTFAQFETSYLPGSRTTNGHLSNNIDNVITQKFCLKCHDADGATNPGARVSGGSARKPFGTTIAANPNGEVLDVNTQFATINSSAHPVKGPRTSGFPANTRLAAPYDNFTRNGAATAGAAIMTQGVVINCFDCHNQPGTPLTKRTVTAHGAAQTLRGTVSVTGTPSTTNATSLCLICHVGYSTSSSSSNHSNTSLNIGGVASTAFNSSGDSGHANYVRFACNYCHSSGIDAVRPVRAENAHGINSLALQGDPLWPVGATETSRPYAFIRAANVAPAFLSNHRPALATGTFTTGSASCSTSASRVSPCSNSMGSYTPGGSF